MVDEAGNISSNKSVSRKKMINLEAPNFAPTQIVFFTRRAISIANFLTRIVDNPFVLIYGLRRKYAPSMQLRTLALDVRKIKIASVWV